LVQQFDTHLIIKNMLYHNITKADFVRNYEIARVTGLTPKQSFNSAKAVNNKASNKDQTELGVYIAGSQCIYNIR
jgi:hypothetical protein